MNKNILFIILFFCLFIVTNITAQEDNYESIFGEDVTVWAFHSISPEPIFYSFLSIRYSDNELVYDEYNDQEYFLVKFGYLEEETNEFVDAFEENFRLLREDTNTGKVWFTAPYIEDFDEVLVMDMSLEVGDTFHLLTDVILEDFEPVDVIDVYYANDRKHIVLDYTQSTSVDPEIEEEYLVFIEGIGPSLDIFDVAPESYVSCVQKDGDLSYESSNQILADQCVIANLSTPDIDEELHFSMYPNPTKNQIFIELAGANQFLVELFDSNGKLVIKQKHTNQKPLNVSRLSAGIYLVKITDNTTGFVTTKKLVKQ